MTIRYWLSAATAASGLALTVYSQQPTPSVPAPPSNSAKAVGKDRPSNSLSTRERVAAVKDLAKVDCHYWPQAEDALVGALRADTEWEVRLAAAETLAIGGCCTKKTIAALTLSACGSDADGNPAEKNPLVIAAAQSALKRCLTLATTMPETALGKASAPPSAREGYYVRISRRSWPDIIGPATRIAATPANRTDSALPSDSMATFRPVESRVKAQPVRMLPELAEEPRSMRPNRVVLASETSPVAIPDTMKQAVFSGWRKRTPRSEELTAAPIVAFGPPQSPSALPTPAPEKAAPSLTVPVQKPASPVAQPEPSFLPKVPDSLTIPAKPAPATLAPTPQPVVPKPAATLPQPVAMNPILAVPMLPKEIAPVAARPSPRALRVVYILDRTVAPEYVESEIDQLTRSEFAAHPPLLPALLKAAEERTDLPVRLACLRAVRRAEVQSPEVIAILGRIAKLPVAELRSEAQSQLDKLFVREKASPDSKVFAPEKAAVPVTGPLPQLAGQAGPIRPVSAVEARPGALKWASPNTAEWRAVQR